MTAPVHPDDDPQHDAESPGGAPETPEESARAQELARLFGHTEEEVAQRSAAEEAASRDSLAALFARPANAPAAAPEPDFTWDPAAVVAPEVAAVVPEAAGDAAPVSAAAVEVDPADAAPVSARARRAAATRARRAASAEEKTDVAPVSAAAAGAAALGAGAAGAGAVGAVAAGPGAVDELVGGGAADRSPAAEAVDGPDADEPESDTDHHDADPLAWLGFTDQAAPATASVAEAEVAASAAPVAARASWLDVVGGGSETTTALPAAVAAGALDEPTAVLPAAEASAGSFFPAERRGIRGWSSRVRWSVAVSIVLLIGVVAGSVVIAQNIAANNLAAQELAAAIAELEAAEESAADPQPLLDEAVSQYDDTVTAAQATADSAAPPLAAVAGMAAQPVLDASNAALAALVAQLAVAPPDDLPDLYARGDVDVTDIDQVKAATQVADDHVQAVTTATREVRAAQAALQEKLDGLRTAQVALGASLPETAVLIVGENKRALQSFRDAVIAASVAVPAAQNAGGSGDVELLAYAAAVTALRNDQTRAATGVTPVTPPSTGTAPAPAPVPVPEPVPEPVPTPTPTPTETTTPDPVVP